MIVLALTSNLMRTPGNARPYGVTGSEFAEWLVTGAWLQSRMRKEPVTTMTTTYAGIDAHARMIRVAVLWGGAGRSEEWQLENEPRAVKRLDQRLRRDAEGPVVACYEAGPTGFALQRQLEAEDVACRVIARALIPRRPGDRVKTDRRDARHLAELLRADLLTEVHPPTSEQEAVRDLCRARHRLAKLLLRRGLAYDGRNWPQRHRRWLLTLRLEQAASDAYREAVGLLRCFRGVDTVTALTVLAELGDVTRFGSARRPDAALGSRGSGRRRRCAAPEQERMDERGRAQEDARYTYAAAAPGAINPRISE